jgi:diadenylate cyclase
MSDVIWLISQLNLVSLIDIAAVALIFYTVFFLIQGTQAVQLLRGIFLVALAFLIITTVFTRLTALSWLVRNSLPALLVSIPVVFQPELRRGLERLGRTTGLIGRPFSESSLTLVVEGITQACVRLSERRHGALIVLERSTGLQKYIDNGIPLDAAVSKELLTTIFCPNTPLHDGALIIRGDRVVAAACVLPLSEDSAIEHSLGTRHMAAVGVTEQSDAIAMVVSEETGIISVAHNGRMVRRLDERRLRKTLRAFYPLTPESVLPRWLRPARPTHQDTLGGGQLSAKQAGDRSSAYSESPSERSR